MDVKCQNCNAEYSLDETLVAVAGTSVRCTKCGQVFNVFRKGEAGKPSDKWLLRRVGGETYSFEQIGVLQQWIAEGNVSPDDLLAKAGENKNWKRIGDMGEMQSFFTLANSPQPVRPSRPIASRTGGSVIAKTKDKTLTGVQPPTGGVSTKRTLDFATPSFTENNPPPSVTPTASSKSEQSPPLTPIEPRAKTSEPKKPASTGYAPTIPAGQLDLSQIPASEKSEWDEGQEVVDATGPAWAEKKRETLPQYPLEFDSLIPPKRKTGRWIVLLVILALVASGAAFFVMTQKNVDYSLFRILDTSDDNRHRKFFDRGYENFLLDSETSYRQADREFQKALALKEADVLTLAALAEMYAVWAQYFRDAETDAKVDLSEKKALTEIENRTLEQYQENFNEKLREAERWIALAMEQEPVPAEAHRAMADVLRLKGDPVGARKHLQKARENGSTPETDYVAVLLDQDLGKPAAELQEELAAIIEEKPLIRAMYRRARILAAQNIKLLATRVLRELFELNSEHGPGLALRDRIAADKPVTLATAPEADATLVESTTAVDHQPTGPKKKKRDKGEAATGRASKPRSGDDPVNIDAFLLKAKRVQERGQTKNAMTLYNTVLEKSPSNIDALSGLAYCYLDIHSHGQAIATFRRALNIQPSFGPSLLGLAETYKSQRQNEQAAKYYKRYLDAHPGGRYAGMAKRNLNILREEIAADRASQTPPPPAGKPAAEETAARDTAPPAEDEPEKEQPQPTTPEATAVPNSDKPETPQ